MNYQELAEQVEVYVRNYFGEHPDSRLLYHDLVHTEIVATVARETATYYRLPPKEICIVIVAAWFHDIGYSQGYLNHEETGAKMAEDFLSQKDTEKEITASVISCILATKMPQKPVSLLEEIICDADLSHFGMEIFWQRSKLLHKELELLHNTTIEKSQWYKTTIEILEQHRYFTEYCREHFKKEEKKNLEKLKKKYTEAKENTDPIARLMQGLVGSDNPPPPRPDKKNKDDSPERTIQTMFRITSGNSQRLSDQADTKAHIMISVNSIIVSVILSVLVRKIDEHSNLTIPVIMLLAVNLVTIVFSILATRPNIPSGKFSQDDLEEKKVNLLFFGNFYRMNFGDYCDGMYRVMNDKSFLYLSILRDVYNQGVILGRKYRMLKVAYNVFMYGLIVSVIVFFIAAEW